MKMEENGILLHYFSATTEHTFFADLGFTDTQIVDYLSQMLCRFAHRDGLYAALSPTGQPLQNIAEMIHEAENPQHPAARRQQLFRHTGDFALFWLGLFPEALKRQVAGAFVEDVYVRQGKRSYLVASTYTDSAEQAEQAPVLRRLSEHFEECADGLARVRQTLRDGSN